LFVFIIGIDPHKASHTATVIDCDEQLLAEIRVQADRLQRDRLLGWANGFTPRVWAVEGATGTGALLAQQLVAVGEIVVDVPPALSARVRLLDSGRKDKTDSHDARSAAVVALRHPNLRPVIVDNHVAVLRLLARRHHQLVAGRTRAICRLHGLLAVMIEGGLPPNLTAKRASSELRKLRPFDALGVERKRISLELLGDVRRHDNALGELEQRITAAVQATATTVTRRSRRRLHRRRVRNWLHRRHHPVPNRRPLRPLQRHRADRSVLRTASTSPSQPQRQPSTQSCDPHRGTGTDQP
jgi:hypothetical protein